MPSRAPRFSEDHGEEAAPPSPSPRADPIRCKHSGGLEPFIASDALTYTSPLSKQRAAGRGSEPTLEGIVGVRTASTRIFVDFRSLRLVGRRSRYSTASCTLSSSLSKFPMILEEQIIVTRRPFTSAAATIPTRVVERDDDAAESPVPSSRPRRATTVHVKHHLFVQHHQSPAHKRRQQSDTEVSSFRPASCRLTQDHVGSGARALWKRTLHVPRRTKSRR